MPPPDPRQTDRVADDGAGTGNRVSISEHCCRQADTVHGVDVGIKPSPISKPCGSRTVCMAGVWGEASPQAPPEARWTAGRSRGASQPWAGGREKANTPGAGVRVRVREKEPTARREK